MIQNMNMFCAPMNFPNMNNNQEFNNNKEKIYNNNQQMMSKNFEVWKSPENLNQEEELKCLDEIEFTQWDQFETNHQLFGYQSTYNFQDYTVPIPKYLTNEQIMKAKQISREIQNEYTSNLHEAEEKGQNVERGDDERFSDVKRDKLDDDIFCVWFNYQIPNNGNVN